MLKKEGELKELEDDFCYRINYKWIDNDVSEEKLSNIIDEDKTRFFETWAVIVFLLS